MVPSALDGRLILVIAVFKATFKSCLSETVFLKMRFIDAGTLAML
jgi:hypothetical protein